MTFRARLLGVFIAFAVLPLLVAGAVSYYTAKEELQAARLAQVENIADLKVDKIIAFFTDRARDLERLSYRVGLEAYFQTFHAREQGPLTADQALAFNKLDQHLTLIRRLYGFRDVLLADPAGTILYSVDPKLRAERQGRPLRELDPAALSRTPQGVAFGEIFQGRQAPGAFSMLMTAPVKDDSGHLLGFCAFELDMGPIYHFIQNTVGLGQTGETLIVKPMGNEVIFQNPLRFDPEAALKRKVIQGAPTALSAQKAAAGESGSGESVDYRGKAVIAAWRPVPLLGWGLVAKMDEEEAFAAIRDLRNRLILAELALVLLGVFIATVLARSLAEPLRALQRGVKIVGAGDLDYKVGSKARDEIGGLSRAFDRMTESLKTVTASRDELNRVMEDRKRAEGSLIALSLRQEAILFAVPDIIMEVDANKVYTWANQAGFDFFGEDVLGKEAAFYFEGDQDVYTQVQPLFNGEENVIYVESWQRRRDGEKRLLAWWRRVLKDETGKVIGALSTARDVTERKRAEQKLRDRETLLNEVGEMARVGGWEVDVATKEVLWTRETYRIHEIPEDQKYELSKAVLFFEEPDRSTLIEALRRGMENGEPFDLELRFVSAKGRRLRTRAMGRAEKVNGKVVKLTGTFQDITERKQLEEQLQQAMKMEAIGRLAGGVAHDFNNQLMVINNLSEFLLEKLTGAPELRADVAEILAAGDRAANLTRQLLAFSRKQVMQPVVMDLNQTAKSISRMLTRLIGEDIQISLALAPELGLCRADPGQMEQVIMNLAVNARDAMPRGGQLLIETANVELDEDDTGRHRGIRPGDYVLLAVTDTGLGMAPEVLAHVFEPFFTTKEIGKGTGMGLATVFGIVKQSGGDLWAYSEPGQGSTFKVYLPRIEAETARAPEKRPPVFSLQGRETVLLVEDDESVREVTRRILESYGYTVLSAASGEEAMTMAQNFFSGTIHLLVTDLILPGISGRDLAAQLSGARPRIRTLFMSGYTDNYIIHQGALDPGLAFLQKPFSPEALARKVRELLGPAGP